MSHRSPILLVDDDEAIRDFVSMVLMDEGFEVVTAPDGKIALELVQRDPPALILLDMWMPVMDGQSFMLAYRSLTDHPAPIIAFTAASQAIQTDADACLAKPFNLNDLLDLIERMSSNG